MGGRGSSSSGSKSGSASGGKGFDSLSQSAQDELLYTYEKYLRDNYMSIYEQRQYDKLKYDSYRVNADTSTAKKWQDMLKDAARLYVKQNPSVLNLFDY